MNNNNQEQEIDLKQLFHLLYSKLKIIILVTILIGVITFLVSSMLYNSETPENPEYSSTVKMYATNTNIVDTELRTADEVLSKQLLAETYVAIIKSDLVLGDVIEKVGIDYTLSQLREMIAESYEEDTGVFSITVHGKNSVECTQIADAIAIISPKKIAEIVQVSPVIILESAKADEGTYVEYDSEGKEVTVVAEGTNVKSNTAIGSLLGFMIICFFIIIRDLLDTKIDLRKDVEDITDISVIGLISEYQYLNKSKKTDKNGEDVSYIAKQRELVINDKTDFIITEEYNVLRTNVLFSLTNADCKVIGVTSPNVAEGKTTISLNSAISLGKTGKKILLVDGNLRSPRQAELLEIEGKVGLSNLLINQVELTETIIKTEYDNLDIILSGPVPSNPSEMIGSEMMKKLIEDLKESYDYILIDLPSVNVVTDAVVASKYLDGLVMIVRANYTKKEDLIESIQTIKNVNAKILGIVLNGGQRKTDKHKKKGN